MWKIIEKEDIDAVSQMEWFVYNHVNGHFMQTASWSQVKTFWDWCGISIWKQGEIIGTMLVLIRRLPLGFSVMYAPRGPVCDRNDPTVWEELMEALQYIAKEKRALLLHLDPDEDDSNTQFRQLMYSLGFLEKADDGFGNIQPQYVFRLQLQGRTKDEIFRSFGTKTRYNIGLSLRKDIIVREYTGAEQIPAYIMRDFYTLMQTTGMRDRFYIRDITYFKGLMAALRENAQIYVAYYHDEPIAGAIEVFCGNKAWYLYGASANEYRNVMPNYLLQWVMIQRAKERGCGIYDFRGVPGAVSKEDPLYGLYRFKKGFSGTYTKFTGLFTYSFRPLLCKLWNIGMKLRKRLRAPTRNNG